MAVYRSVKKQVGSVTFSKPVAVFLTFNPPARISEPWDLDNYKKAMFDSLTICNFWKDDSLVYEDHSYKGVIGGRGNVVMEIEEL